jgi:hypothetical protein
LFNGSPVSGETNTSLVFDPTKPPQGGNYSVVVNNPFGSVTSSNATLTIVRPQRSLLFSSGAKAAGHYEFELNGEAGVRYVIEASEDLQNWSRIDEVTGTGNPFLIRDSDATAFTKRFYRAVPLD